MRTWGGSSSDLLRRTVLCHTAVLVAGTLIWFPLTLAHGQERPIEAPEPIRVRVTEVPVNVIATDRHGRPVLDLARNDFEILENGRHQKIEHFQVITSVEGLPTAASESQGKETEDATVSPQPGSARSFLIFLGSGKQTDFGSLNQLIDWVRYRLRPSDHVALQAYNRCTAFTPDHEEAARIIESLSQVNDEIERIRALEEKHRVNIPKPMRGRRVQSISSGVQERIDAAFAAASTDSKVILPANPLVDLEVFRKWTDFEAHQQASRGQMLPRVPEGMALERFGPEAARRGHRYSVRNSVFDGMDYGLSREFPAAALAEYQENSLRTGWDVSNLFSAIDSLRFVGGEKHLILFSPDGFNLPSREVQDSLTRFASDSRVRIHTFHTSGSAAAPSLQAEEDGRNGYWNGREHREQQSGFRSSYQTIAIQTLVNISSQTGGFDFSMGRTADGLEQVGELTIATYLLSYSPQSDDHAEVFRRIEVRSKREGVQLHYRRGYFVPRTERPLDLQQLRSFSRIASAAGMVGDVQEFAAQLRITDAVFNRERSKFKANLKMYLGKEMVEERDGVLQARMPLVFFILSRNRNIVHQSWDSIELKVSETTLDRLVLKGLSLSREFSLPLGLNKGWLKMVVYDPANDRVSSVQQPLVQAGR